MQAEDRPIHFSTELIHAPARHEIPVLQKLYFELSQLRAVGYDSTDFSVPGQSRFYSRRGAKTQSIALFLPDRLVIIEEWTDIPLSDFLEKTCAVAEKAMAALRISFFTAQTATVRSTFALTHFDDAREFLLDRACQQTGKIAPHFGRPIAVGGLRFVLPETPEHTGLLNVAIESFKFSRNEVLTEVKGIFAHQRIGPEDLATATENIQAVRSFISEHVFPYLDQYDSPEEGFV
ncbi:MAG TPA: hypothetical protein HPP77_08580 [Candidatus Hydrogenedentes bacterium]|nr:hypothetical protein [Candidatus Hydrogenedentota bacterium]HIJ72582.1 hypothetical protein [Candidatus Hydrogenedentota bacterium]